IDISDGVKTTPTEISGRNVEQNRWEFTVDRFLLPIPAPESDSVPDDHSYIIKMTGLADGDYSLSMDAERAVRASAREWSEGVAIQTEEQVSRAGQLHDLIIKKNNIFVQQYRPPNRTYLLGFRSREQGHTAEELGQIG